MSGMPLEAGVETPLETVSHGYSSSGRADSAISTPRQASPFRRRLHRFIRAKRSHRPPLALQNRDLELLRTAHEYRLITTSQFLLLFGDESRDGIYRRLQKLFHHGYLDRIGANPNAPMLYALGRRGAALLDVSGIRGGGDRYIAHQLMIGSFRAALAVAARERGIVFSWRTTNWNGLPVRPDGFCCLQFPDLPEGRNRAFFMLEADRSTMTRERFVGKLCAYWNWYVSGGHTNVLGIRAFRVLTVTKSEERLRSLLETIRAASRLQPALRYFLVASQTRFAADPSSVLSHIWEAPEQPGSCVTILPSSPAE